MLSVHTHNATVTLDDLASMIARGFKEQREDMVLQFKRIDERFEQIDEMIQKMETTINLRLGGVQRQLDAIYLKDYVSKQEHRDLEKRVANLELKGATF